ncbi:hypothetical protein H8S90_08890 [Olivibacter sp. SDN3]|uniref:hypothetical protein n=1 Tax=Olivibacter sp. SDN3 TaxID=2764720 RepID=UPI0016510E8F|nr:hypothetical protein [Olivibacter sp. SDN3]QNL51669.1 hypothetical protein H8S90_08890 [Olivibacter sp. SDN3]
MKNVLYLVLLPVLLCYGCNKDGNVEPEAREDFISTYGGDPFLGDATGRLTLNDEFLYRWKGDATIALLEAHDDSVSIVFRADFGEEGEMNFKLRGQQQGMDYLSGEEPDDYFKVSENNISGQSRNASQYMTFDGRMAAGRVSMDMTVEFMEEMDHFPQGSILELSFSGRREVEQDDGSSGEGCQMKLVPIWSPNGMTMGMVPDCK